MKILGIQITSFLLLLSLIELGSAKACGCRSGAIQGGVNGNMRATSSMRSARLRKLRGYRYGTPSSYQWINDGDLSADADLSVDGDVLDADYDINGNLGYNTGAKFEADVDEKNYGDGELDVRIARTKKPCKSKYRKMMKQHQLRSKASIKANMNTGISSRSTALGYVGRKNGNLRGEYAVNYGSNGFGNARGSAGFSAGSFGRASGNADFSAGSFGSASGNARFSAGSFDRASGNAGFSAGSFDRASGNAGFSSGIQGRESLSNNYEADGNHGLRINVAGRRQISSKSKLARGQKNSYSTVSLFGKDRSGQLKSSDCGPNDRTIISEESGSSSNNAGGLFGLSARYGSNNRYHAYKPKYTESSSINVGTQFGRRGSSGFGAQADQRMTSSSLNHGGSISYGFQPSGAINFGYRNRVDAYNDNGENYNTEDDDDDDDNDKYDSGSKYSHSHSSKSDCNHGQDIPMNQQEKIYNGEHEKNEQQQAHIDPVSKALIYKKLIQFRNSKQSDTIENEKDLDNQKLFRGFHKAPVEYRNMNKDSSAIDAESKMLNSNKEVLTLDIDNDKVMRKFGAAGKEFTYRDLGFRPEKEVSYLNKGKNANLYNDKSKGRYGSAGYSGDRYGNAGNSGGRYGIAGYSGDRYGIAGYSGDRYGTAGHHDIALNSNIFMDGNSRVICHEIVPGAVGSFGVDPQIYGSGHQHYFVQGKYGYGPNGITSSESKFSDLGGPVYNAGSVDNHDDDGHYHSDHSLHHHHHHSHEDPDCDE